MNSCVPLSDMDTGPVPDIVPKRRGVQLESTLYSSVPLAT